MYYSLLEQHADGSWWYNRTTFTDRKKAERYFKDWKPWKMAHEKMILEHDDTLPKEVLWTYDLKSFHNVAGEKLCTLKKYGDEAE